MFTPGSSVHSLIENVEPSEDFCLITDCLENLCLLSQAEGMRSLIDCACPTTVAGLIWMKQFISQLSNEHKQQILIAESERIYKFGGGVIKA